MPEMAKKNKSRSGIKSEKTFEGKHHARGERIVESSSWSSTLGNERERDGGKCE